MQKAALGSVGDVAEVVPASGPVESKVTGPRPTPLQNMHPVKGEWTET